MKRYIERRPLDRIPIPRVRKV